MTSPPCIEDSHPEDTCQRCDAWNPVWFTDSEAWNTATEVVRRGRDSILCPSCFVELWEGVTGRRLVWKLEPEFLPASGQEGSQ